MNVSMLSAPLLFDGRGRCVLADVYRTFLTGLGVLARLQISRIELVAVWRRGVIPLGYP